MNTKNLLRLFIIICLLTVSMRSNAQICTLVDSMSITIGASYAYGVAWDGSGLWISGNPAGHIFKYNLAGQKVDTIYDPAHNVGDASFGMVCVGTHLFTVCYSCDTMYEIDLATKQVINRYVGLTMDDRVGIGYDGVNTLYFVNGNDGAGSYTFDISNGTFTPWATVNAPYSNGLIYFNQHLYGTLGYIPSHIIEFDTLTGAGSNLQNWCVHDPFGGLGMTFDGQYIWQATVNGEKIYKILFNPALGINETGVEDEFEILGNPVHDQLTIKEGKTKIESIELLDVIGKTTVSKYLPYNKQVDISFLASGIYILKAYAANHFVIGERKIIKD
ncbi:MAG: T9SS type A sorting domain-containing protein [Bacteroidota bacterium]